MGDKAEPLTFKDSGLTSFMMVGLQGAGKTTTAGKLANLLRKKEVKKPLLVALDIYRPAAVEQLVTIGEQLSIDVFEKGIDEQPVDILKQAIEYAKENGHDLIVCDTAGRLHINEELMGELKAIKAILNPDEILLTIDAMTGQDAISVATSFDEQLGITGAILTKLDGDTRGGAALSLREVTNIPIKYMGLGKVRPN